MKKRELEGREEEFLVRYDAVQGCSLVLGLAGRFRREGAELGFLSAATRRGCSVCCAQRGAADGKLGFGCSSRGLRRREEEKKERDGGRHTHTHRERERERDGVERNSANGETMYEVLTFTSTRGGTPVT